MNKIIQLITRTLSVLILLPCAGYFARATTIDVITTFDYPGSSFTRPQKINDDGTVAGIFIDDATGFSEGFTRARSGKLSHPIVEPNDTVGLTEVRGINNIRRIVGDYTGTDGLFHGFIRNNAQFREFDISSSFEIVLGINNASDLSGSFIDDSDGVQKGFVDIGGTITSIAVSDASATLTYQINDSNQSTGYYIANSDGLTHGYLRDSDGSLTLPIDPSGSTGTILFGNNNANWVVGRYSDVAGLTHGLFFTDPSTLVTYDFAGSTFTSLNGINNNGYIVGRYADSSGLEHGFIARVTVTSDDQPNNSNFFRVPASALRTVAPAKGVAVVPAY
jgi:hypothetical protein